MRRLAELTCLFLSCALLGCGGPPAAGPSSQRLVDVFEPAMISGSPQEVDLPSPTEWRFAGASGPLGWETIQGVEGLGVHDGRMTGRVTGELPILMAKRPGEATGTDSLQEIRVRMRASAGKNVAMHFVGDPPAPVDNLQARRFFWAAEAPIVADGEMRTYTFSPEFSVLSPGVRDVYLRPSDVVGAEFEIESIRLVFQREYLAEKSSGVSWQGLDSGFRETVTARAPETIRWPLTLPQRPRLEVGLGTLDPEPVTFRMSLETPAGQEVLAERTLTTPDRWNDVSFDLDRHAGEAVTLVLSLDGPGGTPGAAGWTTAAYSAVPHTSHTANMHQGYETLRVAQGRDKYFAKTARDFVDRFLPWLDRHRDERFFVFLHVFDPHFPYEPRPPYDTMWTTPAEVRAQEEWVLKVMRAVKNPLKGAQGQANREEMERAGVDPEPYLATREGWYDGSIRAMDEEYGRIFQRLRELGLDDRVLVAFTSDHGEEFLDHDGMGHGHSLYGELTHVPLVLWRPGLLPTGLVVDEPVQHLDVLPTLLELSGLPVPETARGRSLLPLVKGGAGWREVPIVSERPANPHPMTPPPREYSSTSLIFEGWKLIHHGEGRGERPEYELYDHRNDPGDTRDLAAERPEVVERLAGLLEAWRRDAEAHQLKSDADLGESVTQEELERLRSLGYIQ